MRVCGSGAFWVSSLVIIVASSRREEEDFQEEEDFFHISALLLKKCRHISTVPTLRLASSFGRRRRRSFSQLELLTMRPRAQRKH